MAPPTRLHPFSMVRGIDPRGVLQAAPAVAIVFAQLGSVTVAGVALLLAALAAIRVVSWQRHTFELTGDAVIERRGILQRRERTLQLARLQQVEVDQGVFDRLVGTAVLRLETAAEAGDAELELKVVGQEQARLLRASLLPHVGPVDEGPRGVALVEVPLTHVVLAAVTGPRLLAVPVLLAGALGLAADLDLLSDDPTSAVSRLWQMGAAGVLLLLVVLVAVSVVAAVVVGLLRDGAFRIRRVGDDLHVRRGLLATREAIVPLHRVQLVLVHRSWIRRALGFATVTIRSAGGVGGRAAGERRLTVPLLPEGDVEGLVLELLGRPGGLPLLHRHPPVAQRRAVVRRIAGASPVLLSAGGTAWAALGVPWPLVALVVAVGLVGAGGMGVLGHQQRASGASSVLLAGRSGALGTTTVLAPRRKAQGVARRTSPFQRRVGLATLLVHVAGPGATVTLVDLDAGEAERLHSSIIATPA